MIRTIRAGKPGPAAPPIRPQDYEIRRRFHGLMRNAKADEGLFIIPSYQQASRPATEFELIADGQKFFGDRCLVTSAGLPGPESLGGRISGKAFTDRWTAHDRWN